LLVKDLLATGLLATDLLATGLLATDLLDTAGLSADDVVNVSGTWVVQAQSPLAMDANRCTWVPRTSEIACFSASHNSGNSSATWETGQWC
jgi:hypothetical protein